MRVSKYLCPAIYLTFSVMLGTTLANAQIVYTCDPSVAASTCNYLNTVVSGHYSSTFSNANANIYITFGKTGLGQSVKGENNITYAQYVAALSANTHQSPVQAAALSALGTYDAGPYGSGNVRIGSALGTAFGLTGLLGVTTGALDCDLGTAGCYDGVITITTDPAITLYYIDQGGTEPDGAYDFYTTVEHETDEVLGTSSCINTGSDEPAVDGRPVHVAKVISKATSRASDAVTSAAKGTLSDECGAGEPSPVDLYRYQAAGALILDSSLSTKDGAYFSYDGGATNGADGVDGSGKHYNTKANTDDYADFTSNADCSTDEAVQDAEGCPSQDAGLNILNDGRGEINILNAVGFNLVSAPAQSVTANKPLVDFKQVAYPPTAPKVDGLELENHGSAAVTIGTISIVATYGDASQFAFASDCLPTLDPGKKCHIALQYNPDAAIISRAILQIPTSPGSTISVPLTGAGVVNTTE